MATPHTNQTGNTEIPVPGQEQRTREITNHRTLSGQKTSEKYSAALVTREMQIKMGYKR